MDWNCPINLLEETDEMRNNLTLRPWIGLTILVCLFFFCLKPGPKVGDSLPHPAKHDQSIYSYLYLFLDMEQEAGVLMDSSAYQQADRILDRIYSATHSSRRTHYTYQEVKLILEKIHRAIRDFGIRYDKNHLLSDGLITRQMDCDNLCILYLSAAQYMELPLSVVNTPRHVYIRWEGVDRAHHPTAINWETQIGRIMDDEFYRQSINPALMGEVYLKKMTLQELIAAEYLNIGLYFMELGDYYPAVTYFERAGSLNPKLPGIYNNIGNALSGLGSYREALDYYNQAIEIDTLDALFYSNKGNAWLNLEGYDSAYYCYRQSIRLDSTQADTYNNLSLVLQKLFRHDEALEMIDQAIRLHPEIPDYYFNKAAIYYQQGKTRQGDFCYQQGLRIKKREKAGRIQEE